MPIFDVQCEACGFAEEVIVNFWRRTIKCSRCGRKTKKLWTKPPYVKYVGEGFNATSTGVQWWNELPNVGSSEVEQAAGAEAAMGDSEDWDGEYGNRGKI